MFHLFAGHNYYPEGGFDDFEGAYPTLDSALHSLNQRTNAAIGHYSDEIQWFQIVRIWNDGWEIVAKGPYSLGAGETYNMVDVTTDDDKTKRVMWMPVNGEMK